MGAKVISSLLVGIGLDFDEKSTKGIDSSFDQVKSSALKLGAVIAGAFGINKLTSGFSESNDVLGKFSETYGVIANDVAAFDRALQHSGGQAGEFISLLESLEKLRAGTRVGDFGFVPAAEKAGIDTKSFIDAENTIDAFLSMADVFSKSSTQKRFNMAEAMGLSDAAIRMLGQDRSNLLETVDAERNRRPITQEMLDLSRDFNDQWQDMNTNIGRVADTISVKILPHVNSLLVGFNNWLEANDELIDSGVDEFIKKVADNIELVAVGVAALAAPSLLFGLGLVAKTLGGIARMVPVAGAGVGGFMLGEKIHDNMTVDQSNLVGRSVATVLSAFGVDEASQALNAEAAARAAAGKPLLSTNDMPEVAPDIYLTNTVVVDGEVIEKAAVRVLDASVRTMADELRSTTQ